MLMKKRKPHRGRARQWYEEEPDIRIEERTGEVLLESLTKFTNIGRYSMQPFGVERYLAFQTRRDAYAKRNRIRRKVQKSFAYLKRAQMIVEAGEEYRLTLKGWTRFMLNYARNMQHEKRRGTKGKRWYIVIFDIPEEFRRFRDSLRMTLYSLGFSMLQQSVFVTHEVEHFEMISKIVSQTELMDRVKLIVGERVL